jgi:hypothetical protein
MLTVLALAIAVVAPSAVLGLVFVLPAWLASLAEARRRRLRTQGRLAVVAGRPLEKLAADLRRLRPQRIDPGRSHVQREAARLAYEDVLREVARALGIAEDLAGSPGRLARELEALRIEEALHDAGLVLATKMI